MKLILVRHGETIENVNNIWQGQGTGRLSKNGMNQAKKLALRLKDEKIDCIFSSDQDRTLTTVKEIAQFHDVPLIATDKLRERFLGSLQGQKKDPKLLEEKRNELETFEAMEKRSMDLLNSIIKSKKYNSILFAAHKGINRSLESGMFNLNRDEIKIPPNAAVSIFEIKQGEVPKTILYNCIKHLK